MIVEILLIVFAFLLVISGGTGVILPFLPGVPIAWLGLLAFGYATDFAVITWKIIFIFLGLTAFTFLSDFLAPLLGAKKYNASRYGIIGSFIGVILGIVFLGPLGIIIGPLFGTFLGEIIGGKNEEEALESAKGNFIGFLVGNFIKITIVMIMFGYLIFAALSLLK